MVNSLFDSLDDALAKASNKKLYDLCNKVLTDILDSKVIGAKLSFLFPIFGEQVKPGETHVEFVGSIKYISTGSRIALVKGILEDIRPKNSKRMDLVAGAILQQQKMTLELLLKKLLSKANPQKLLSRVLNGICSIFANPQCYLETLLHSIKDSMGPNVLLECMSQALSRTSIPFREMNSIFALVSKQSATFLQKSNYPTKFLHDMVEKASVFLPKAIASLPPNIPEGMQSLAIQMFQGVLQGIHLIYSNMRTYGY